MSPAFAAPLHALLFGAVLTAGVDPSTGERTAVYRCGQGIGFSLIYEKKGTALVMIQGGAYRLKPAGKDTWSDGMGQSLVVGDNEATWTSRTDGVRECNEVED